MATNRTANPTVNPAVNQVQNLTVTTTIELNGKTYSYPSTMPEGSTAADLITKVAADNGIDLQTKDYPSMGLLVQQIMNVAGDDKTQTYWIYYINGESAQVGISQYKLKQGDTITWKYEKSTF